MKYFTLIIGLLLVMGCSILCSVSCRPTRVATMATNWRDTIQYWGAPEAGINQLPDSIFKYRNLAYLNLGPAELTVYPPLSALAGTTNRFTALPPTICLFKRLKILDLTYNQLAAVPDLSCLDSLAILNLSFNEQINIARQADIAMVKQMKSLRLLFVAGTDYKSADIALLEKECPGLKVAIGYDVYLKYLDTMQRSIFNHYPLFHGPSK